MPLIRSILKRRKASRPPVEAYSSGTVNCRCILMPLGAHVVDDPIDAGWWWPSADFKRVPVSPFEAACQERTAARRRLLH